MSDDGDESEGDRDLGRLITFLDAIVAIAITLLVLPLTEIAEDHPNESAGRILAHHTTELALFVLSFFVIARLWRAHHQLLEFAASYDSEFLWVNILWALTIVVVPFATQLTTHGEDHDSVALSVYLGTMAASSGCLFVIALLLDRRPELRRPNTRDIDLHPAGASMFTFLIALVLGLAIPSIGYWGTALLVVDGRVARWVQRRRGIERSGRRGGR